MAQLVFEITNQLINRIDNFKPVEDSKNYLYAHFNFLTNEWDNQIVTINFTKDDKSYIILLDNDNNCLVPWELLTTKGDMFVSAYAGDLATTNKSRVTIYESGYVEEAENSEPPTPNIYAQILDRVYGVETDLSDLRQDLLVIDGGSIEDWG